MDIYGDYDEEDLTGLSIVGGEDLFGDDDDPAAQWLAAQEAELGGLDDNLTMNDELVHGNIAMKASDLQLGRIGHLEPRIQAGIKAMLEGKQIEGINPVDQAAAVEQFAHEIGMDVKTFAKQIRVDEAVQIPRHKHDLAEMQSVLGITSTEYMDRGPGAKLPGNIYGEEKQAKADDELKTALGYVKELADIYLDDRTRGTGAEAARRLALEESLTKRFLDGTFYEGSKDLLPLPNETGVTGIKRTQGIYGSMQGTAEDRLSSSKFDSKYKTFMEGGRTKFLRDDQGFKVFKDEVSQKERNEILRATPSLEQSLFPKPKHKFGEYVDPNIRAKETRDQQYAMQQAQFKADYARRVLRKEMPTLRDESKGQVRMTGWDSPVGDQADLQNLRNEAAIQGITWDDKYAGQGEEGQVRTKLDDYIETEQEKKELLLSAGESLSPKQGTQEWLNQRKGKITASTAAGLLKSGGIEERALELAMERLGTAEKFAGNADTREGNEGEDRAGRSFMAQVGSKRGLTLHEAYFEENPDIPNFGVSPDGRLYDKEGNSAGLLELKYLSSGSMAKALDKYTPQMQMQMAITGESQTHFYALDKFTGDYVHEIVEADPKLQEQLIEAGQAAVEMASGLDNRGVQALRNKILSSKKANKGRSQVGKSAGGQTTSFEAESLEAEEPMTPFRPETILKQYTKEGSNSGGAAMTALAKKMKQQDQSARMKDALEQAKPESALVVEMEQGQKQQLIAKNAYQSNQVQNVMGMSDDNGSEGMAAFYKEQDKQAKEQQKREDKEARDELNEAKKREAEESKKITEANKANIVAMANFRNALNKSLQVGGEIANLVMTGNESVMSEERLAAEGGTEIEILRGTRKALEIGGLSDRGIEGVLGAASQQVKMFNDEATAAARFTELVSARGKSNLEEVRGMPVPALRDLKRMDMSTYIQEVAYLTSGMSPEAKAQAATIFGLPEMASFEGDIEAITIPDENIDGDGARDVNRGIRSVEQEVRDLKEMAGTTGGEEVGAAAKMTDTAVALLGSATAGAAGALATKIPSALRRNKPTGRVMPSKSLAKNASLLRGNVTSGAAKMMEVAKHTSGKAMTLGQKAAQAAKLNPTTAAMNIAPMVVRGATGIEDDNSTSDSLMDIAEMAGYGAAVGSAVPVVGTAVGAAIGGGLGAINEGYEALTGSEDGIVPDLWNWAFGDEVVPSKDIGKMPSQGQKVEVEAKVGQVNVNVLNEISKDLVRTTTDVNGDVNIDEDSGIGTGG